MGSLWSAERKAASISRPHLLKMGLRASWCAQLPMEPDLIMPSREERLMKALAMLLIGFYERRERG